VKILAATALLCAATAALVVADVPRVSRAAMEQLEARIDGLFENDKYNVLGNTRGVYLDGYGAVFTTLISVRTEMPSPFNTFTPRKVAEIHAIKLREIPDVRVKMRQSLLLLASSPGLDSVRTNEQVVFDITMLYYKSWEDTHGLPREITMQAEKGKLLAIKPGTPSESAQLDAIVKVQEQ
jgi:hypothetical protein